VKGKVVAEENRAYETSTSRMGMEVEAVSRAFFWLERYQFTLVVFITDSLSMLRKIKKRMFRAECLESLKNTGGGNNMDLLSWTCWCAWK
jgi:ribonuclease HI